MRVVSKIGLVLSLAVASSAGAQQTIVSAAPGGSTVIGFDGLAGNTEVTNQFSGQGVTVSGGAYTTSFYSAYFGGSTMQVANFADLRCPCNTLTFTFAQPVNFFGMNAITNGTVTFTNANGSVTIGAPVASPATFAGFTDGTAFSSVTVSASGNNAFAFDNLSFTSVTTTPEPSAMALLGTGFIGLVPMIRRKRKQ